MRLRSMKIRFAIAIAVAYVVIAIFTYLVFCFVTNGIVRNLSTDFAVKQVQLNKAKLMSTVQHDLALSLRMSESSILVEWALDEENPELKKRALKELESYRASFKGQSITFISDRSKHHYFHDGKQINFPQKPRYTLSADNLSDAWYFRVMREVDKSELNVDYDEKLNMTRVWFNVVIRDGQNNKIGVGGSSIDITEFINEIVHTKQEKETGTILFSRDGAITGHKDSSYVTTNSRVLGNQKKITVYDLIDDDAGRAMLKKAMDSLVSGAGEVETGYLSLGGKRYLAAVSYLKEIDWFNLVLVDTTYVVSNRDFSPIIATIIVSLLAVIIIIGLLLNKIVLAPLSKLSESASQIARGNFDIALPVKSSDEIGALYNSFNEMSRMVKDYTNNLEEKVTDRTTRLESANYELLTINEEILARSYELEHTLDALQRSEDKLRLILDSTAEAIYGTDLNGNCTFCNTSCVCMLGYSHPDDLIGKNMHGLIHYQHKDGRPFPEEECPINLSLREEEGIHVDDEVFLRADGRSFPVEYWAFPQFSNGKIVGAVATFMDITDRIQTQEKLLKLSRAVENSPATVVITDRTGMIEYVNPKFTECTGYLAEEAIGLNPRILNAGVQSKAFYKELWTTITAGSEWRGEFCNRKKNGEIHWEHASISPLRDEKGVITHFVAVKEDITDRRRIAEELHQAKEAAEAANLLKSEFLANMSHEIRTPLNAIIGFSELALRTELSRQSHDYVKKISNAGESLLKTINDILDFSKIEAGKLDMEHTLFTLDDLLSNVISVVQQKAAEKRLQLSFEIPPELPGTLVGDPHRLGQVIINLMGNAVKFTQKGSVKLVVSLQEQTATRVKLRFAVSDTGVGLSAESLSKLFQPFTQADGSTTRRFGGTGLGLSISKKLVEMMEGEIWGESKPGAGSVFSFTAWLEIGEAVESYLKRSEGMGVDGIGGKGAGLGRNTSFSDTSDISYNFSESHILLVEDNEINRQLAIELLKRVKTDIDTAVNGREALTKILSGAVRYDLVLMDIQMPEMDGYEATRLIRQDSRFTTLPIIAMTAHAMLEERQKIAEAGLDDHITKPVNSREMFRIMSLYLDQTPAIALPLVGEEQETEQLIALPEIPGLDTEVALERLDENRELYLQILEMFISNQANTPAAFQKALDDENRELAERIAHTCRGVAGNIGATDLQHLAMNLESAIKRKQSFDVIDHLFKPFADELDRILQALRESLPALLANPQNHAALDKGRATIALNRLQRYIRDNDGRAENFLQECREELAGLPHDELDRLRFTIANFDYAAALGLLVELSTKAGIGISAGELEELS